MAWDIRKGSNANDLRFGLTVLILMIVTALGFVAFAGAAILGASSPISWLLVPAGSILGVVLLAAQRANDEA